MRSCHQKRRPSKVMKRKSRRRKKFRTQKVRKVAVDRKFNFILGHWKVHCVVVAFGKLPFFRSEILCLRDKMCLKCEYIELLET